MSLTERNRTLPPPPLLFSLVPWEPNLLDAFAQAKFLSFRGEMDARVFPCLSEFDGCRRLMRSISEKPGFIAGATWLAVYRDGSAGRPLYCGTVQGVRDSQGCGAIQNLGVVAEHRGRGLGESLLLHALDGFRRAGLERASLEVTAENHHAIHLYRKVGFATVRTVFKAVETVYA